MVERRVASFFDSQGLRPTDGVAGVALSGGADSVALLAAMRALGWRCVALHCNFHLRGAESDRDAAFAEETARKLGCGFLSVDFDVEAAMEKSGESLEMACRTLRYDWFEGVARKEVLLIVAIAHHADDAEETFLLNALRGSGLKGLCGIPPRRGIYLRPMLDCSRSEVVEYLAGRGLGYVTDSSNLVGDVKRNKLRLNILPEMRREFPSASKGLARTMANLRSDYDLFSFLVVREAARYVVGESIDVAALVNDYARPLAENLLYRLMKRLADCEGDSNAAIRVIASAAESGRYFDFGHRRFLLDRGALYLLSADTGAEADGVFFSLAGLRCGEKKEIQLGDKVLTVELLPASAFSKTDGKNVIWLDAGVGDEELLLRHPLNGDRVYPFGMNGSTLVSKLMKDAKIPDNEKPRQWVLLAGDKVLWLCGIRCSKHYPVTAASEYVFRLSLT